jgi:hypothetical protein
MTADGWLNVERHLPAIMDMAQRIDGWLSERAGGAVPGPANCLSDDRGARAGNRLLSRQVTVLPQASAC